LPAPLLTLAIAWAFAGKHALGVENKMAGFFATLAMKIMGSHV
jgi:hypothetical protein